MPYKHQMKEPRRVFIYCRVSGDAQEDNTSLEHQERDNRAYAEEQDLIVVDVIKEVFTGTVWKERKQFMEMRDRYLRGEADSILVRTFDRLTRVAAHFFIIRDELRENGINLLCTKEKLPDDPILADAMITLKMSFVQKDRETIVERVQTGKLARVTEQQRYLGGYKPPYGYRFDCPVKKNKLVVYEPEAKVVRTILDLRAKRYGILAICKYLVDNGIPSPHGKELWGPRTVRTIIERAQTLYRGIGYAYKNENIKEFREDRWVEVRKKKDLADQILLPDGTVERLISDELAAQVLEVGEIMTQEAARNNKHEVTALLRSGFAFCGICGSAMTIYHDRRRKNGPVAYYRCCSHNRPGMKCPGVEIVAPMLDTEVWTVVCRKIKDIEDIEKAIGLILQSGNLDSAIRHGLKAVESQTRVVDQYRDDLKTPGLAGPTRAMLIEDMNTQAKVLEQLQHEVEEIKALQVSRDRVLEDYKNFSKWRKGFIASGGTDPNATYQQKRDGLRFMGVRVRVYKHGSAHRADVTCDPKNLVRYLRLLGATDEEELKAAFGSPIDEPILAHGAINKRVEGSGRHFIHELLLISASIV